MLYEEKSITSYYYYYIINISDKVIAVHFFLLDEVISIYNNAHNFSTRSFLRSNSLLIRFHRIFFSSFLYTSHAGSPSQGL